MVVSIHPEAIRRRNGRVDRYRQLVRPIALHYASCSPEPLDDLVQVGLLGLLRAAERFSETSTTPFDAFARPHIRGAILHYLRDRVQPIRLPRRLQEKLDLRRRCLASAIQLGRCPLSDEQLRQAMGMSPREWQQLELARQLNRLVSLDEGVELDGMAECLDGSGDSGDDQEALRALDRLEPSLAAVVRRVVLSGWSYRRTAAQLEISPMTVQRRLHRGLDQLRRQLEVSPPVGRHRAPSALPVC